MPLLIITTVVLILSLAVCRSIEETVPDVCGLYLHSDVTLEHYLTNFTTIYYKYENYSNDPHMLTEGWSNVSFDSYHFHQAMDVKVPRKVSLLVASTASTTNTSNTSAQKTSPTKTAQKTSPTNITTTCTNHPFPYKLVSGVNVGHHPGVIQLYKQLMNINTRYNCGVVSKALLQYHVQYIPPITGVTASLEVKKSFDADYFLSLLSHQTMTVIGDSLAKQLFIELVGFFDANIQIESFDEKMRWTSSSSSSSSQAKADNTVVQYCNDNFLDSSKHSLKPHTYHRHHPLVHNNTTSCVTFLQSSDIVVISVGAWFKPFLLHRHAVDYVTDMRHMGSSLRSILHRTRAYLNQINPKMKVIWVLGPHSGKIEELNCKGKNCQAFQYSHSEIHLHELLWNDIMYGSIWRSYYNRIIREVALFNDDLILDVYSLSLLYLEFFRKKQYSVHKDSLHYCYGGLFHGVPTLLQQMLSSNQQSRIK